MTPDIRVFLDMLFKVLSYLTTRWLLGSIGLLRPRRRQVFILVSTFFIVECSIDYDSLDGRGRGSKRDCNYT